MTNLPGLQLAFHPMWLDPEHEEHGLDRRIRSQPPSREQGLGVTEPAVRSCCFKLIHIGTCQQVTAWDSLRAAGRELSGPARVPIAMAGGGQDGRGKRDSSTRLGSGTRTKDTSHRREEPGHIRDPSDSGGKKNKKPFLNQTIWEQKEGRESTGKTDFCEKGPSDNDLLSLVQSGLASLLPSLREIRRVGETEPLAGGSRLILNYETRLPGADILSHSSSLQQTHGVELARLH